MSRYLRKQVVKRLNQTLRLVPLVIVLYVNYITVSIDFCNLYLSVYDKLLTISFFRSLKVARININQGSCYNSNYER